MPPPHQLSIWDHYPIFKFFWQTSRGWQVPRKSHCQINQASLQLPQVWLLILQQLQNLHSLAWGRRYPKSWDLVWQRWWLQLELASLPSRLLLFISSQWKESRNLGQICRTPTNWVVK